MLHSLVNLCMIIGLMHELCFGSFLIASLLFVLGGLKQNGLDWIFGCMPFMCYS